MVKAGSAGSNPDSVTTTDGRADSQPLRIFLNDVGRAVFVLNTVVVGLDAVERGHSKPETLDISWEPREREVAARQARKFILEAVIVRTSEAIAQYVAAVSKLPRMADVRARWADDTGDAERTRLLSDKVTNGSFLGAGTELVIHWRNRIVHSDSRAKLAPTSKKLLQDIEDIIEEKYRGLSVDLVLAHFEEGRPTLKDVSSLIAMSINWARSVDAALYDELEKDDLDAWIDHYQLREGLEKLKAETSPEKLDASILRFFRTNAPGLTEAYERHYLQSSTVCAASQ